MKRLVTSVLLAMLPISVHAASMTETFSGTFSNAARNPFVETVLATAQLPAFDTMGGTRQLQSVTLSVESFFLRAFYDWEKSSDDYVGGRVEATVRVDLKDGTFFSPNAVGVRDFTLNFPMASNLNSGTARADVFGVIVDDLVSARPEQFARDGGGTVSNTILVTKDERFIGETDRTSLPSGVSIERDAITNFEFSGRIGVAYTFTEVPPVPLPASLPLFLAGLALVGIAARSRRA